MAINLSKGGNVNLSKEAPTMTKLTVGLGWDARVTDGKKFDLDASAFLLGANGKVAQDKDFIFYGEKNSLCGSVIHNGDNRTGDGDGDDESIAVDLTKVPASVERIVVAVTIHDGIQNNQNFGQIQNAYIRIVNSETNSEVARFDLTEDGSTETAMIFGELQRNSGDWKFRAVGQGFAGGLGPLASSYGVSV